MAKRTHDQLNGEEVHMRFIVTCEQAEQLVANKQKPLKKLTKSFNVKLTITPFINLDTDRVMSITGTPEDIGCTIGSLVRTWTNETSDLSTTSSTHFSLCIIIPDPMMSKVVGHKGTTLRKLHRKTSAKLEASKECLFESTDRQLTAVGVADALHRACYFISVIFQGHIAMLKEFEKESAPYEPQDKQNPLRRRISGFLTPPESPTDPTSRKKRTAEIKPNTIDLTNAPSNKTIMLSPRSEPESPSDSEDLVEIIEQYLPSSPPAEKEYTLASRRHQSIPPLQLDTSTSDKEEIVQCPPSPALSVDDEVITKRLMVTCPMVGTVMSLSEELLNILRQNSGAAVRVKEIMNDQQVQLIITGTKAQVSRVSDDLMLTTRNSYLFTKALETECDSAAEEVLVEE
ncbi:hypothetical protein CJU89_1491 [Yarrowia sp. B02]|nr:hypothetical protein CJU89_1491 [Yarrowia sp. B02]